MIKATTIEALLQTAFSKAVVVEEFLETLPDTFAAFVAVADQVVADAIVLGGKYGLITRN